jgi:hypothetical protein
VAGAVSYISCSPGTVNLAMIMTFFFFATPRCSSSSRADTATGCGSKIRIDHLWRQVDSHRGPWRVGVIWGKLAGAVRSTSWVLGAGEVV